MFRKRFAGAYLARFPSEWLIAWFRSSKKKKKKKASPTGVQEGRGHHVA